MIMRVVEPRRIKNGENKTNKKTPPSIYHHHDFENRQPLLFHYPPKKEYSNTSPTINRCYTSLSRTHGLPTGASQDPIQKLMDYAPKCFIHFRYWTERRSYWFFFMICYSLSFFFNFSFLLPRSLTQHFKAYKWSHRHKRNGQLIWNPMETDITLLWRSRRSLDESPSFPQENVWKSNISTPFWRRWKIPQYFVL